MGVIVADGLWRDLRTANLRRGLRALFLDRDGTLIENVPYNADPDAVRPFDDAVAAVRAANAAGWAVVVVTNQSGVGRGYYDWPAVEAVQERMYALFAGKGATIDATYAAGHAPPEAGGPPESPWRKPAPGMLLRAAEDLGIDLAASVVAGDGAHDLAAGKAAGLPRGWLVPTGYGANPDEQASAAALADNGFSVTTAPLSEIVF